MSHKITPKGFRVVKNNGRICYSAKHSPDILCHHEKLRQYLLHRHGDKAKFSDQTSSLVVHKDHRFFLKVDIKNAFDSIDAFSAGLILELPTFVEENYTHFFHERGGLIQGAQCSPLLFNLYFRIAIETELHEWATTHNLTWTRYVDDILFSRNKFIDPQVLRSLIKLLSRHGFTINRAKTRLADSYRQSVSYLGVDIYRRQFDVSAEFKEKLRVATAHNRNDELKRLYVWQKRVLALNSK